MSAKKNHCSKCGRKLSDPFSIAIGMGPECRGALGKKGWKFPKPRWKVSGGRIVLDGMDGKIEPPILTTDVDTDSRIETDKTNEQRHDVV